jgi:hypothetical protein
MSSSTEDQTPPLEADEPAPSRLRVLTRNPRRLIIALGLIAIAIAVAVFATATFTTSSANAGNLVAAGTLAVDSGSSAILNAANMVPGESRNGTVSVQNTGTVSGNFSLTTENLRDTPASPAFSAIVVLLIQDVTHAGSPVTVYNGKLNAVHTVALGNWPSNAQHNYKFTVTFPSQGSTIDNRYKGASTTLTFRWNAVST